MARKAVRCGRRAGLDDPAIAIVEDVIGGIDPAGELAHGALEGGKPSSPRKELVAKCWNTARPESRRATGGHAVVLSGCGQN